MELTDNYPSVLNTSSKIPFLYCCESPVLLKVVVFLEQASKGVVGLTVPGGVPEKGRRGTEKHGSVDVVEVGWWLDYMILESFPTFMILCLAFNVIMAKIKKLQKL